MVIAFGNKFRAIAECQYAISKVRYFKDQYTQGFKNFEEIGFTDKDIYRANFPTKIIADGFSTNSPYVQLLQSSGTSGDRLVSALHTFKMADRMANSIKANRRLNYLSNLKKILTIRYAAPNCSDVECSNPNASMADRILQDGTLVLPAYHDLFTTPKQMLKVAFDEMHSYPAQLWYMDPMHLSFLIRKSKEYGWKFSPPDELAILFSYTMPTKIVLRQIRDFFNNRYPIGNVMGMSEFGYVGVDCEHGRLHLNIDDYYLEFFPIRDTAQLYELVITSIGDRISPHIRYRTKDIYRLYDSCPCGSDMPAVMFQGRIKDTIRTRDGHLVTPRDVDAAVGDPGFIDAFQLSAMSNNKYVFRYQGSCQPEKPHKLEEIRYRLIDLLRTDYISLERCEYFPFERGGKFPIIRFDN